MILLTCLKCGTQSSICRRRVRYNTLLCNTFALSLNYLLSAHERYYYFCQKKKKSRIEVGDNDANKYHNSPYEMGTHVSFCEIWFMLSTVSYPLQIIKAAELKKKIVGGYPEKWAAVPLNSRDYCRRNFVY